MKRRFDSVDLLEMTAMEAANLSEIARISAYVNKELVGILYGRVIPPIFKVYGSRLFYERSTANDISFDREESCIRNLRRKKTGYEFLLYHTHPDVYRKPSPGDLRTAHVGDIEVIAQARRVEVGLWRFKKFSGVTKGSLIAYRVRIGDDKKLSYEEIPIKTSSLFIS
jgi:hypothetical protein